MTEPKDARHGLKGVMDALADHAERASDKELLEEAATGGMDVQAEAERVRGVLLDAVLKARKERLARAQQAHKRSVADLNARVARLPETPTARRALLMQSLQRRPQMREAVVTLQHREFDSFSDADVESALKQLGALGVLDDDSEPKP